MHFIFALAHVFRTQSKYRQDATQILCYIIPIRRDRNINQACIAYTISSVFPVYIPTTFFSSFYITSLHLYSGTLMIIWNDKGTFCLSVSDFYNHNLSTERSNEMWTHTSYKTELMLSNRSLGQLNVLYIRHGSVTQSTSSRSQMCLMSCIYGYSGCNYTCTMILDWQWDLMVWYMAPSHCSITCQLD